MSLPRCKQKAPDIISGIPFDETESVNFVMVSKQKQRLAVSSAQISVPVTPLFHANEQTKPAPAPSTTECDNGVYSNTEGAAMSAGQKADHKGPSRSVSVSLFYSYVVVLLSDYSKQQTKLEEWFEFLQEFIDETMRHASPSRVPNRCCATCLTPDAPFQCLNCFPLSIKCQHCLVATHQHDVLHRIQVSPAHKQCLLRS